MSVLRTIRLDNISLIVVSRTRNSLAQACDFFDRDYETFNSFHRNNKNTCISNIMVCYLHERGITNKLLPSSCGRLSIMNSRIRTFPLANNCLHHAHSYHQLVIAATGRADFEIDGIGGRIDASNGCLVPGGEVHSYEGIGENNHVVVDLPAECVDPELVRLFEAPRYFEADSNLRLLLSYIQREAPIWQRYPEATEGMVQSLLAALHHRTFSTAPAPDQLRKLDLAALDIFIHQHLHEPLPVARLAGAAHRSVGHFHVLFRDATGVTPYRYVSDMRLSRARELLLESSLPLTEISNQVGFSSQSALTHAFRRQYGEPPGRLRRLH